MGASPLSALRQELARRGLDGFIVPRADEHLGEYVPASAERLAWLTGFTGSAGFAVVLAGAAAVFTDGRYILQLSEQTDASLWQRLHVTEQPPHAWLAEHAPKEARIGYDPLLISEEGLARFTAAGIDMVPLATNPIDSIWADRPAPPGEAAVPHELRYAGVTSEEKRADVAKLLREAKQDAAVLTDPASIAWLLNIRGNDVPFTPFALSFAVIHADGATELFIDPAKAAPRNPRLARQFSLHSRSAGAGGGVAGIGGEDGAGRCRRIAGVVRAAASRGGCDGGGGRRSLPAAESLQEPNRAQRRAAGASARRGRGVPLPALAGHRGADRAARPRSPPPTPCCPSGGEVEGFRGESFPAISGAGEHGAIIHYRVTPETNRRDQARTRCT